MFTSDTLNEPVKTVLSNGVCNVGAVLDKLSEISLSQSFHNYMYTIMITEYTLYIDTEFAIESSRTGVKFIVSSDPYVFYNCDSQSK